MLEPMHSLVTNCSVVDACVQVRAESPMEHSAQGKRSDTLGIPMLEQSRPERAKALQCALGFYRTAIKRKSQAVGDGMTGGMWLCYTNVLVRQLTPCRYVMQHTLCK